MQGHNWTRLTASSVVCQGPALLLGYILNTSSDGGDVTIYAGQDASSGRQIAQFQSLASVTEPQSFPHSLFCDRGIYAAVGSNVTAVTIIWARLFSDDQQE